MEFEIKQLSEDVTHIVLNGRLDVEGTLAIEQKFSFATTVRKENFIVDLDQVSFMSSFGIRLLLTAAKAQSHRGGKLILASPQPAVRRVIETAGIDQLIPVVDDVEAGIARFAQ